MNTQERDQLSRFLQQLSEVKLTAKDPDAEAMISDAVSRQPDAAYLLVQRAMLLDQALNNAKAQIGELQHQLRSGQAQSANGFFNNDPWAQPASTAGQVPGAGSYQMPRYAQQAPMQAQPQPQSGGFLGGGSSFLGNVATTAAGVVAGSFLFQGIENLMGHHSPASAWDHQASNMPSEHATEEYTTINNYYGDDAAPEALHTASYDEFPADEDNSFDNDGESDWM